MRLFTPGLDRDGKMLRWEIPDVLRLQWDDGQLTRILCLQVGGQVMMTDLYVTDETYEEAMARKLL